MTRTLTPAERDVSALPILAQSPDGFLTIYGGATIRTVEQLRSTVRRYCRELREIADEERRLQRREDFYYRFGAFLPEDDPLVQGVPGVPS